MKIRIYINELIDLIDSKNNRSPMKYQNSSYVLQLEIILQARKLFMSASMMSSFEDFVFKKYYISKSPLITTNSTH